jgi:hypothetical protein
MPDPNDWNASTIAEFRANEGRVGGPFEGAPLTLVHHHGRKSRREYVKPVMYMPDDGDDGDDSTIYTSPRRAARPQTQTGTTTWSRVEKAPSSAAPRPIQSPCARSMAPSAIASTSSKLAGIPDSPTTPSSRRASAPSPCCR